MFFILTLGRSVPWYQVGRFILFFSCTLGYPYLESRAVVHRHVVRAVRIEELFVQKILFFVIFSFFQIFMICRPNT